MFPVSIAMAATWDTALIYKVATTISDEARAIYNGWHSDPNFEGAKKGLIYRAPVINLARNPYWGRINECYGEDPYLSGRIGVSFVKGLQGDDPKYLKLVATLKHYAVNNVEIDRHTLSAQVSERMLREYWLPQFRDCIIEGQAQSVMASYNAINGVPNSINKEILTEILKDTWGFEGFVVSDLGAIGDLIADWGHYKYPVSGELSAKQGVARAINAGVDFSDKEFMNLIPGAVESGLLPQSRLDDALYRVLRDRFRLGEFDPPSINPYSKISPEVIGSPAHRSLALKTAQESIVLLTNRNNTLPLNKEEIKTLAVIGPLADIFVAGGYSGVVKDPITPLQGIKNRAGKQTRIVYAPGIQIKTQRRSRSGDVPFYPDEEWEKALSAAKQADAVVVVVGTTLAYEREGYDRTSLGLPDRQAELVQAVLAANPKSIVVEVNAGPLTIPTIKEQAPAILETWWNGEEGGNALADVLFGHVNPGGKLPYTVYASEEQVPPQDQYDVSKGFTYMYIQGRPLFAFGHGLSYTNFSYSDLKISNKQISPTGSLSLSLVVKNTGRVQGDEVVQVYTHAPDSPVQRPSEELRGFARVSLAPGESKTINIEVQASRLAYYDESRSKFVVQAGTYDLRVGSASDDIRLKGQFQVTD
jgi:beta-glucosidase